jgi:hypothetical protein
LVTEKGLVLPVLILAAQLHRHIQQRISAVTEGMDILDLKEER